MVIDIEHHLEPKESFEASGGKTGQTVFLRAPDGTILRPLDDASYVVEVHLKHMDLAGIDMAVLSAPEEMSLEKAKTFNDFFSRVVKQCPGRFAAFAVTVPLGGDPAFAELDRAVKELGLKG
jgi:aminocarboxymuconate-semialdehyde decarboxylase